MSGELIPRAAIIQRGKDLAERVMCQYWRCTLAPHNLEEGRKFDKLRETWAAWELQALAADINLEIEFGDTLLWLRPHKPKPVQAKRSLSLPELVLIPRLKRARVDLDTAGASNIWNVGY